MCWVPVRLGRSRIVLLAVLVACMAAGAVTHLAISAPAQASSYSGCYGAYPNDTTCALGVVKPLNAMFSYDDAGSHRVCAGAERADGSFYGNFACGIGYAQHCYDGEAQLQGVVGSGDKGSFTGYGTEVWNEGSCP